MDGNQVYKGYGRGAVGVMMQKILKKLPEMGVLLLCIIILFVGISQKEGYHMDELLTFELANAEYNPWIVPTQPEGRLAKFIHNEIDGENWGETLNNMITVIKDVLKNGRDSLLFSYRADVYEEPTWITAKEFQDYIMVDKEDSFNLLSVYFNVKDDNHPPVFFMLLHIVSSLFQGRISPYMGCLVNVIAVAVTMCLLMQLGKMLAEMLGMEEKGRLLGLLAAFLYGTSQGAMASVLLIRMYCVMTCLCVASAYYHVKKWQRGTFQVQNKGLILVTVLGFWTQYFFLFYCIVLAVVTAVLLWCHKRKRELVAYIRSMVMAAVIGVVCFPFAVSDVFSSERGVEALENLSSGIAGFGSRIVSFWNILSDRTFGVAFFLLLSVVVCVAVYWGNVKKEGGKCEGFRKSLQQVKEKQGFDVAVIWMLIVPMVGYFLLAARMSPYLVDRYIMALFPLVILAGVLLLSFLSCLVEACFAQKNILYVSWGILIALQLFDLTQYDGSYLYRGYEKQEQLAERYAEYPCICIYEGVGYYENLLEFTRYNRTLLTTGEELEKRQETESLESLDSVIVLMKNSVDVQQVCDILREKYGLVLEEDLLENSVYGDLLCLFVRQ